MIPGFSELHVSVHEQNTKPLTAPDKQAGALHGFLRYVDVNEVHCKALLAVSDERHRNAVHLLFNFRAGRWEGVRV